MTQRIYQCDETESLSNFIFWMGRQLAKNQHKPGWSKDTPAALAVRLKQELAELQGAIKNGAPYESIASEAADVANFAMMIQDLYWDRKPLTPPRDGG